jgi:hypothetical protein
MKARYWFVGEKVTANVPFPDLRPPSGAEVRFFIIGEKQEAT